MIVVLHALQKALHALKDSSHLPANASLSLLSHQLTRIYPPFYRNAADFDHKPRFTATDINISLGPASNFSVNGAPLSQHTNQLLHAVASAIDDHLVIYSGPSIAQSDPSKEPRSHVWQKVESYTFVCSKSGLNKRFSAGEGDTSRRADTGCPTQWTAHLEANGNVDLLGKDGHFLFPGRQVLVFKEGDSIPTTVPEQVRAIQVISCALVLMRRLPQLEKITHPIVSVLPPQTNGRRLVYIHKTASLRLRLEAHHDHNHLVNTLAHKRSKPMSEATRTAIRALFDRGMDVSMAREELRRRLTLRAQNEGCSPQVRVLSTCSLSIT